MGRSLSGAAIPFAGDPWEILDQHAPVTATVPLAVILTLPATGSESNSSGRHQPRRDGPEAGLLIVLRLPAASPCWIRKRRSRCRPRQVANGIVDAFVHTLEQYLTYPVNAPLQDRFRRIHPADADRGRAADAGRANRTMTCGRASSGARPWP